MISSTADKIKYCRKYFNLSQNDFTSYGISQNYLSMIESGKRIPSTELLEALYRGFYDLTAGEVEQLYTKEAFLLRERDEINNWVEKDLNEPEKMIENYDEIVTLCQSYNVYDLLYSVNYRIGKYYKEQYEYLLAIEFFLKSIELGEMYDLNLSKCYYMIASCMRFTYSYDNSLTYYSLAYRHLENKKSYIAYKIQYYIALVLLKIDQIEQCLDYLDIILRECNENQLKSLAYILKSNCLFNNNQLKIAKKMLYEYIKYPIYEDHLKYIYHTLVYYLLLEKDYTEALLLAEKTLQIYQDDCDIASSKLILSLVYREMKEYDKAIQCCIDTKRDLTSEYKYAYSELWYKQAMVLCLDINDHTKLLELIVEIKKSKHTKNLVGNIKDYLLQEVIKYPTSREEQINQNYQKIKYICEHM